ncbi:MAG: type IV secretory system conjugative DNA transfer family protein [Rhodococcus sp. (in: high G+C Gram-positive bacteria)]|uniref:type IV secretory system conjugative DNA transfer family protein n=1 Tax=Rhodococcus sp. TaxID=1831 RepID=UPI002ADB3CB9|nr:type IV secretory system conjugative DNA transfer family protein [Rhodococcus sp. (in: high G+C Gram-positive bacteria)]
MASQRNQSVRFAVSIVMTFGMCMALTSWVATQYLAARLDYQAGLGDEVLSLGSGRKLYHPFAWFVWNLDWMHVEGPLQTLLTQTQLLVVTGAILSVMVAIYLAYRRSLKAEATDALHGSAHWATQRDVEKMGLVSHERAQGRWPCRKRTAYKAQGVYLGAVDTNAGRKVLRYNEPAHVLAYWPSRSGKGVGLVLPTLLSYPHSVATNDIKGENYELSSGFRHSAGSLVVRFDPTALDQKSMDGHTHHCAAAQWNVLDEIRRDTEFDVMDTQNIAAAIADPDGEGMDDHWVSTSYALLVGVVLHVLYFERDKSLTGVATYLADPTFTDPEQMYNRMLDAEHDPTGTMGWIDTNGKPPRTHPQVALAARSMLNKEEKERNSVLSSAKTKLSLYTEPIVARNIARSDFRIADLMNHERPVSLYLVVPPSDKERLRPLIRLFFSFLLRRLTSSMAFEDGASTKEYKHRLLLLIDELASLKKLEQLQDGLSYIAGYGITAYLFVQDEIQLTEHYGDKQTITAGCQIRVAAAPNTLETAKALSEMTGVSTRKRQNVSYSGSRISSMLGQMSVSEDLVERPLMTEDEIMRLPRDECLVFNAGHPPIRGKKLQYFKMDEFMTRAKVAPPSRVAATYRDAKGLIHCDWFMVSCERRKGASRLLDVSICCYATFPQVRVVVKQENLETEQVNAFPYELCTLDERPVNRTLSVGDHQFVLKPCDPTSDFDPAEALEVHFMVAHTEALQDFSQKGFFRDSSLHEREMRRAVRDHFFRLEEASGGERVEPTIERATPNSEYHGTAEIETAHFVGLIRHGGMVSLHRKCKLSRAPTRGEKVTITYAGKKGAVQ